MKLTIQGLFIMTTYIPTQTVALSDKLGQTILSFQHSISRKEAKSYLGDFDDVWAQTVHDYFYNYNQFALDAVRDTAIALFALMIRERDLDDFLEIEPTQFI